LRLSWSIPSADVALSNENRYAFAYLLLVSTVAAYFLTWPIWRAQFFVEIWPTESWNAYWQDAAVAGAPIYPDPASLIGNNYPPLSFYAVAWLGKLTGLDNLFAGRALSLIALATIGIEIFAAVRLLLGGRLGAAFGALWYLAIMARNSTIYIGTNDPQLAGLAIMGAGLVYFLSLCKRDRSPVPALLLMVVGGFWKHNNIAIPLAAVAWLFINDNRYAYRATAISAAACIGGIGTCVSIFGSDFLPNLLASRGYGVGNVLQNIGHLQWSALAFLIWAAWAFRDRSPVAQFTAIHIGLGLFSCILQWFGHGVSGNAEFDLILAIGVGIGVAFAGAEKLWLAEKIGSERCRGLIIAALLIRFVASDRQETALLLFNPNFRGSLYSIEKMTFQGAERVAAVPGNASCFTKLICRLAGKPFSVDEFKTDEMIETGQATRAGISNLLALRKIITYPEAIWADPNTSISAWLRSRNLR
jgi:hypothetical protein